MFRRNGKPVLVAEISLAQAEHLGRALEMLSREARLATSPEQILELVRSEILQEAIVAVELDIEDELALAYLAGLPAMEGLVAVGPANEAEMEIRARTAGAQVYLPRPVTAKMLSGLPWINNRDRLCSSSGEGPRDWPALAGSRSAGFIPTSVRELGGEQVCPDELYDRGQTSSFFPFSLPGL